MRKPFYRKQTKAWHGWIGEKQVMLVKGPKSAATRREAERLFIEQTANTKPVPAEAGMTVRELIGRFLEFSRRANSARTYKWYVFNCGSFGKSIGPGLRLAELTPYHATEWLQQQQDAGHSDNSRAGAIRAVMRVFNWALKQRLIEKNPLLGVERPKTKPRDVRIASDDWEKLLSALSDDDPFKTFLTAMRATGARPFEVRSVEARHIVGRSWVFDVEESKGKRIRRSVPLNDAAFAITQRLAEENPTGPLFRNRHGRPWTAYSINNRFVKLADKTASKRGAKDGVRISAYAIRHEFISNAIERGVDPVTLAKIVGHADQAMISRVYAHLGAQSDHVQRAVKIATGEAV